jgi:hypothetical protein
MVAPYPTGARPDLVTLIAARADLASQSTAVDRWLEYLSVVDDLRQELVSAERRAREEISVEGFVTRRCANPRCREWFACEWDAGRNQAYCEQACRQEAYAARV